jgi:flagellar basal body-associated protein FliL
MFIIIVVFVVVVAAAAVAAVVSGGSAHHSAFFSKIMENENAKNSTNAINIPGEATGTNSQCFFLTDIRSGKKGD